MIDEHEMRYCDRCGAVCNVSYCEITFDAPEPYDNVDICGWCWQDLKNWIAKGPHDAGQNPRNHRALTRCWTRPQQSSPRSGSVSAGSARRYGQR